MKYFEGFSETPIETVHLIETGEIDIDDVIGIDELMPIITDCLRSGRGDLVLPFYEKVLPYLEDVTAFAYGNLLRFDAWLTLHQQSDA